MLTRFVRTRIILYTNFEPNTMLLSSKNFVRTKNALKVWAAVCHPDFSKLLFQGIFTFKTLFIAHISRPAHTLSL